MPARRVTENPAHRLTITLDDADRELDNLSKDRDCSLAWTVREAIRAYLSAAIEDRRRKVG